ncbi:hypothetical protein MMAN_43740 [Mycobacterium mantenii]|uniref:Uncharacterized protein n=1 Tax=Mycobacterium mantenii TaxID=560555 RepID=A0ABM7JXC8_MYCNT|nr:hypothetical protein MMAN_43740 [Mycobacterium mantenii]
MQQVEEDDAGDGHQVHSEITVTQSGFDMCGFQQLDADNDEQAGKGRRGDLFDEPRERYGEEQNPNAMQD